MAKPRNVEKRPSGKAFSTNKGITKSKQNATSKTNKNKKRQLQAKNAKLVAALDGDVSSIVQQTVRNSDTDSMDTDEAQQQKKKSLQLLQDIKSLNEQDIEAVKQQKEKAQKLDDDLLRQLEVIGGIKI